MSAQGASRHTSRAQPEPVSPARREAFAILLGLEKGSAHADDLLRGARVSKLSPQDRNLATSLVMGALRWQIQLDALVRPLLARPNARIDSEIRIALRLGAYQLLYLDRIPAHAAIGESVALAKLAGHKFASGMVNAVLRKLAAQSKPQACPEGFAEATAHPRWMVDRWISIYGPEITMAICHHGQQQPELTIRLSSAEAEADLAGQGIEMEPGAILSASRSVLSGDVTATQAFKAGHIRIQDEGSQLIAELAGHGANILDCCAAPGGKTLILAERNLHAKITACEISPGRLEAMRRCIAELNNPDLNDPDLGRIEFLQADAAQLADEPQYDLILADVPCSGTGTLGRNPEIRHRLQPDDLLRHHQRQCAILKGAMRAAANKDGKPGRVLYSTCSLEPEENQDVIAEVLAEAPEWQQISIAESLSELRAEGRLTPSATAGLQQCITPEGALSLLPGSMGVGIQTDGFFAAVLARQG